MKNLFKTLITVITVVCMLSSMTAFAASQTTVTKYESDTNVNVVTTVSGVADGVIVTYLVANSDDATVEASEIKYINQATSDGNDITFSYAITDKDATAGTTIADVQFGSDNSGVASELNDDTILYDEIEFVVTENGAPVVDAAEISYEKIGQGDKYTDVVISALPGYIIDSITIGGVAADKDLSAHTVAFGQKVEVSVAAIEDPTVYLFKDATVEDGYDVYDQDGNKLSVVTGVGYYVGGPAESASIVFEGCDIDGAHADGTYEAVIDKTAKSGYFAVQLASANEADLKPATDACVVVDGETVYTEADTVLDFED